MGFFGGGGKKQDPASEARAEASRQSIVAGGLPLNAMDRLREQASRQGTPGHFFSSDLSVNELTLTHECGFDPLGQVMGSCCYNVGWQFLPNSGWFNAPGELAVMSQAQMDARQLAFSRLRQEAKLLKADGVVGVRFERRQNDWGSGKIEFIAVGTAVRRRAAPPLAPGVEPFVSNLSGQDHWMLRKEGFAPVGFAFGNCSWYQPDWRSANAVMNFNNTTNLTGGTLGILPLGNMELQSLTQSLYTARELAMGRMEQQALEDGADGVVGMHIATHMERIEAGNNQQAGFMIHFTAWGTAVARQDTASGVEGIQPVVSIQDIAT